ncbi:UNVERIFIED_CONTAM: RanBP2-type zinc finger protein [Sesamum radiatum]|uniref:RanBP2-type zinc finger protein n=1 Tax=Sesamum radiatum TaxID=300843 RepID=A0AAW2S0S2_SESRA
MSQVDSRNSSATKRARTDGGRREDDWTCPSCGNVNFSFRTTCNMRNCTQPRPADHTSKSTIRPMQTPQGYSSVAPYVGAGAPSSMYMDIPPYASSLLNGPSIPPYDMPFAGGSAYHYNYGNHLSGGSPYRPLHLAGHPPYTSGSMMGNGISLSILLGANFNIITTQMSSLLYGIFRYCYLLLILCPSYVFPCSGMYGVPPLMDRYGLGLPMSPTMGLRPGFFPEDKSQKKADGTRDNDWSCPKCGNVNFSFRTVCNMRKCNTPKPGPQGAKSGKNSNMPEGSWKCDKCNNINYPFRTKCNRQNCGADKPSETKKSPPEPAEENDQDSVSPYLIF